jgi:CDP-diacylglycerol--glycerol-3-phosphate 3-phosphatidyltransferase
MWLLAVASLVTVGQRVHAVRNSPGAVDKIELPESQTPAGDAETGEQ